MRAAVAIIISASVAYAAVEDDLRDGDRYFEDGNWQKAAAAYDRAIDKAPGQVAAEAYGKRAAIFIILKDYRGGLAFVSKAKGRSSVLAGAPELLEQEALLLWETSRKDEAIGVAERVVAVRPQTFTNQKLIGEYYATRNPARTADAYEAYLATRPGDLEAGDVLPRIRLGFARLALARSAIADSDEAGAQTMYGKAAEQFETLQRRLGKRPNAQVNADNGLCAAYTGLGRFDKALTVCERIVGDPKRVDATGAVWFNLGTAYLARNQAKKARSAATEFSKLRKGEARGQKLLGDTFFAEREWATALDHYLRAEKLLKANQSHEQIQLSIQLGKTYRRMPGAGGQNLALAIEKLDAAYSANPASTELAIELGNAYLEAKQDGKAAALTDKLLAETSTAGEPPETRAALLVISGKALFNQKKLREARQRFESARELRSADISIQRSLVLTINEQAFAEKEPKAARELLEQALPFDPQSPVTLTNLAILAIDRGDCDAARKLLLDLADLRGRDEVVRTRLLARTYLCAAKPDLKRASEAYAIAEREAKKANATLTLAEIYTEWAPLTWDADLDGTIDRLEFAVTTSNDRAGKRTLALALYRNGWKSLREGRAADAVTSFGRALEDRSLLEASEPLAVEFSQALALLDAGRSADAARQFKQLAQKGNQASYLRGPYAKVGAQLFSAYAQYRTGPLAARQQAAVELNRLGGEGLGGKLDELLGSVHEVIAYDQWRAGQLGAATKSLALADKFAQGEAKRRITVNRAALSLDRGDLAMLESMTTDPRTPPPPEVLVNLGILYDRANRPRDAYDAWVRAKARGANARDLQRWIDAKKRIYGY